MKRPTYIFGHLNPDTDSICSAIAYCELKKELEEENVAVFRLGKISKETQFVLEHFDVPVPPLLKDVKPQLSDLQYYEPVTVSKECSLSATWEIMKLSPGNTRIVAIIDEDGRLTGVATMQDITRVFMEKTEEILSKYEKSYINIMEVTSGELVHGSFPAEFMTGSFYLDVQSDMPNMAISKADVVIITDRENIKKFAPLCGCLIVSCAVADSAADYSDLPCCVISTPKNSFQIISGLEKAISIGSIMKTKNIESFSLDNYIEDVIEATKSSVHRNFPVLDQEERLIGVISRRHLIDYERKKVILIDHNEEHQSVDGIEHADIVEIIDHHRVANIQTQTPLFIRSEPVGASATIIFKMYMENFLRPKKNIAGIMLSAILSDTLMFNSPTCTKEDIEAAHKLAKIAGLDLDEYGELMFRESASFDEYTEEEILGIDRKEFSFGKYKAYISQVNTIDFKSMAQRQDKLFEAMRVFKEQKGSDFVILMITDIINTGSEIMVVTDEPETMARAFDIPRGTNSIFLPGVVSRKKQVVPLLMRAAQL